MSQSHVGTAPLIISLDTNFSLVVNFTCRPLYPRRRATASIAQETALATAPAWTGVVKRNSPVPACIRTPVYPARNSVTILTELLRLH